MSVPAHSPTPPSSVVLDEDFRRQSLKGTECTNILKYIETGKQTESYSFNGIDVLNYLEISPPILSRAQNSKVVKVNIIFSSRENFFKC